MAKPSPRHARSEVLVNIGKAVRIARKVRAMSQEQLALNAVIDRSYLGGVERGEHNLTVITLYRIADALDVAPAALLAGSLAAAERVDSRMLNK
jgi:transcriptional regulator with XRE-family HTH domain